MRVAVLTTDTPHHAYFVRAIAAAFPLAGVVVETATCPAPFETAAAFERDRDDYERSVLLGDWTGHLEDIADTRRVASINDADGRTVLAALAPDVSLVFGTGRLRAPALAAATIACLNLHGGNPEEYRGLDTHLWAIYHRDFDNLVTTLHHVDLGLDTGAIVAPAQLPVHRTIRIHELRAINSRACVALALMALRTLEAAGTVPSRRQVRRGRYYSFMPTALKEACARAFHAHVGSL